MQSNEVLEALYQTIIDRREQPKEGSYTCYLFEKGLDKILKKVGEECSETIIAAKNGDDRLAAATIMRRCWKFPIFFIT